MTFKISDLNTTIQQLEKSLETNYISKANIRFIDRCKRLKNCLSMYIIHQKENQQNYAINSITYKYHQHQIHRALKLCKKLNTKATCILYDL